MKRPSFTRVIRTTGLMWWIPGVLCGVVVGGKVLAKTTRSRVLFETGLSVRYYIHPEDVMMEPSGAVTQCPYKGSAENFRCESAATLLEDIVWTYPGSDR